MRSHVVRGFVFFLALASLSVPARAQKLVATIPKATGNQAGIGNGPTGLAIDPAVNHLYVANSEDGTVTVIELSSNRVLATIPVVDPPLGSKPFDLAVDPSNHWVYVVGEPYPDPTPDPPRPMPVINGTNNQIVSSLLWASKAITAVVDPINRLLYLVNRIDGRLEAVHIGDPANPSLTGEVPLGGALHGVALQPNTNRLYVGVDDASGVKIVDGFSLTEFGAISTEAGSPRPVVSQQTNKVYVGSVHGNEVLVLDGGGFDQPLKAIPLAQGDHPWYADLDQERNRIYVGSNSHLNIIDGNVDEIVARVGPLADNCGYGAGCARGVAVNPVSQRVYVADWVNSRVYVISDARNTLTVTRTGDGTGTGTVVSEPAGIDCGDICNAEFNSEDQVALSATPAEGSYFQGWAGGGCSGTGDCTVVMTDPLIVYARFLAGTRGLTVSKFGSGTGTVTSSPAGINCGPDCTTQTQQFPVGTTIALSPTPATGCMFWGWKSGACSGSGECGVVLDDNKSVTAEFRPAKTALTVTLTNDGEGTITSSPAGLVWNPTAREYVGEFDTGTQVALSAAAQPGAMFSGWSGSDCSGTAGCSVLMTGQDVHVTASFLQVRPRISIVPAALNFSDFGSGVFVTVPVGNQITRRFQVVNNGLENLTLGTVTTQGDDAWDFWVEADGCSGQTLVPGQLCTVDVVFSPGTPQPSFDTPKTAELVVASNDPAVGAGVAELTGLAAAAGSGLPKIDAPAKLDFGSVVADSPTPERLIKIRNVGKAPLVIRSITVSGDAASDISLQEANCRHLQPQDVCTLTVIMTAQANSGSRQAVIQVTSNDPKKPTLDVKVVGKVKPPKIDVDPTLVEFPATQVGYSSPTRVIKIKNVGLSTLTVRPEGTDIVMTGDADDFVLEYPEKQPPVDLVKGDSLDASVYMKPTVTGAREAVITFPSNDPKHPTVEVKLKGKGK